MLRVKAIPGEATRYWVESNSLQCVSAACGHLLNRRWRHVPFDATGAKLPPRRHEVGDPCPRCGSALDLRFHVVDIASYGYSGQCSCEFFQYSCEPKVARLPKDQQGAGEFRCHHIRAARDFALDVALHAHNAERYWNAKGQREENTP